MHAAIDGSCCPAFTGYELNYIGSSYPEALACIQRVGCGDTVLFTDILNECKRSCNFNIPRLGRSENSVCYATLLKSAASHGVNSFQIWVSSFLSLGIFFFLYFSP
jgi:hypothetical protein